MDNAQPLHPAIDPTLEPIREAVRKLPPYPFRVNGEEMRTDYVNGLKACETPDALRDFIALVRQGEANVRAERDAKVGSQ